MPNSGGRFGEVRCGSLQDRTRVTIKCLRLHTVDEVNSKIVKHAAWELYYWSRLKHHNVLELLGFSVFQDQLAMISHWMENGTMNEYIRKHPEVDRWPLCFQASEGLVYVHSVGMVHSNLKAASLASISNVTHSQAYTQFQNNILVSADGVVKLSDFGNSVVANHSLAFSATNIAGGGTARWMAPELITGEDGITADRSMPADIYAFGMTILEVMTGRKPYSEYLMEPRATLAAIQGEHPRQPDELSQTAKCGGARWNLIVTCWNMHPDRCPTAKALNDM
ncbi:hypothetical protein FRC07_005265, partial [Ceratobasidium sp. 392]